MDSDFLAQLDIHPRALDAFLLLERCDQAGNPSGRHLSHMQMLMNDSFHRPRTDLDLIGYWENSYASIFQNGSLNLTDRCLINGRREATRYGSSNHVCIHDASVLQHHMIL